MKVDIDKIIEYIEKRNDELWKRIAFCNEHNMKMEKTALLLVEQEQKDIRTDLKYNFNNILVIKDERD